MMAAKTKVGVWGVGGIGGCAVRELVRIPEIDLVSALVYSDDKDGKDLGTLVGLHEVGVKATTDIANFLAAKPDCVFYAARDFGDFRGDSDIVKLLEAGVNVITPLPYQNPKIRGPEVVEKFEAAGKKGGATLFGTGINPGFMYERLGALMTTLSHEIQSVQMREFFNHQHLENAAELLKIIGFGSTPEDLARNTDAALFPDNYIRQTVAQMGDNLGISLDRIERTSHHVFADEDFDVPGIFPIARGTAAVISYKWTGYSEGRACLSTQNFWYIHERVRPSAAISDDCWLIEVEGRPSTRVIVDIQGSLEKDLILLPDNPTPPGFFATVIAMINAIPRVLAAEPGLLTIAAHEISWRKSSLA
jgi:2,4-diaminopentanoate dehydrogenase